MSASLRPSRPAVGIVVLFALLSAVPVAAVVWSSLHVGAPGTAGVLTLENYPALFRSEAARSLANSLIYTAGVAACSIVLGTLFAWLVARTDLPLRGALTFAMVLPLFFPRYLLAIAWVFLLSPRIGLLNDVVRALGLPPFDVFTLPGMVVVSSINATAFVFLTVLSALTLTDASLEEAASTCGARPLATAKRVTLPLLQPVLFATSILILIFGLSDFDIPALLGPPGRIEVYVTSVFISLTAYVPPQYGVASAEAVVVSLLSLILFSAYTRATRAGEKYAVIRGKGVRSRRLGLRHWRWPALAACALYLTLAVVLPIIVVFWGSLSPYLGYRGLAHLTLDSYRQVLVDPSVKAALRNTLGLALAVPTVTVLLGTVMSFLTVGGGVRRRAAIENVAMLPFAVPPLILAYGLLWTSRSTGALVGNLVVLALAYTIMFTSFVYRMISGNMMRLGKELFEAARVAGASWTTTLVRIGAPLVRNGMLAAWVFVFILSLRELGASVLLVGSGAEVVSVSIYNFWIAGYNNVACALAMIVLALGVAMVAVFRLVLGVTVRWS